jgi:membrane fusion protein (multidrug efflux system)
MRLLLNTARLRRTAFLLLTLSAAAGLAACGEPAAANNGTGGGPGGGGPGGGPGGGNRGPGGGPNAISPVEIALVERATIARTSVVTGQLAPLRVVGVTSQTAGALVSVPVEEGSLVRRGDVLAELDGRELRAQLRAAEASVAFARATAERSASMYEQRVVTAAEYERDRAALASAEATLEQVQTRLGFTRILSPIDGVVTQRFVQTGDIVGGATRMFTVADVSSLVTLLPVSELEIPLLRTGSQVPVQVDALGRTVTGRIRRIFPMADSANRLVPVEVAVPGGARSDLRPGYSVRVTLELDSREGALVIPTRAVVGAAGSQSVYLIRDGKAERRRVRVGQDLDGRTEVIEGLVHGDTVITTGNALLREGASVRIVQPLAPETSTAPRSVPPPAPGARP